MVSAVLGHGQTTNPSTTTPPVNGPFGGPILVTPSAGFPNPVPTAGISDAGRAGISNATNEVETTTAPASPATIVTTPSASLPASTNEIPANNPGVSQTPANDLGNSSFVGGPSEESGSGTMGVAEVSSRYKAEKGTRNAKILSNEDVQAMLEHKSGVTMAKNMPPLEQNGQAAEAQNATQSAQSTQQTKGLTNQGQIASGQTGTPPPAPGGQAANSSASAEIPLHHRSTKTSNRTMRKAAAACRQLQHSYLCWAY
ncbi:MAG TPA: hypothetical protein VE176_07200 [Candidatus Limnocylindrales bacterium]|nr:hypothetical protein [Candidatus Limnocylindrales bacterium]